MLALSPPYSLNIKDCNTHCTMGLRDGIRRTRFELQHSRANRRAAERESELASLRESLESHWSEVASLSYEAETFSEKVSDYITSSVNLEGEAGLKALSSLDARPCGSEGYSSIRRDLDVMGSLVNGISNASRHTWTGKSCQQSLGGCTKI